MQLKFIDLGAIILSKEKDKLVAKRFLGLGSTCYNLVVTGYYYAFSSIGSNTVWWRC